MTLHQQSALELLSVMSTLLFISLVAKAVWPEMKRKLDREKKWEEIK